MQRQERQPTRTLPPLNLGLVFKAYIVNGEIAILDEESGGVWFHYDFTPTIVENITSYPEIKLLEIPKNYGKEKVSTIGGVGKTVRIMGVMKGNTDYKNVKGNSFENIFVTNINDRDEFLNKLNSLPRNCVNIEEMEEGEDEYGLVAKLLCELDNLHVICANIARLGAKIFVYDKRINSFEFLGIERLDRREEQPKRAPKNWNYSFLPDHWDGVPTLWYNLVYNLFDVDIDSLPKPLQQYVASFLINEDNFEKYKPYLQNYIWVSASLEYEQSKQLLTANYILNVEQSDDPLQTSLSQKILWRYLVMRGYSSRWLGKYDQNAKFLGNGLMIRKFKGLVQYDVENLSTEVLEKVYKKDGTLQGKGNKGSRSKYVPDEKRYKPKRRMKRYSNIEDVMKQKPHKIQELERCNTRTNCERNDEMEKEDDEMEREDDEMEREYDEMEREDDEWECCAF